jgi:hypothetical protein
MQRTSLFFGLICVLILFKKRHRRTTQVDFHACNRHLEIEHLREIDTEVNVMVQSLLISMQIFDSFEKLSLI